MLSLLLPLLASPLAHADTAALPELSVSWRRGVAAVTVQPPAGEHLAPDAPVSGWFQVDEGAVFGIEATGVALSPGLWIALPEGGSHTISMELKLSLCQDGGSACRVVDLAFETVVAGRKGYTEVDLHAPIPSVARQESAPLPSVEQALAKAGAEGKLALIDFATPWCPPCNVLAAEVLHDPQDAGALAGFVLARVDADEVASWPVKTRYHVGGYPTLVAARPDGTEIDRLVGYPGEAATLAWLAGLPGQTPITALPAPEAASPAVALDAALRLARAYQDGPAAAYLARLVPALAPELQSEPRLHLARFLIAPTVEEAQWLIAAGVAPNEWLPAAVGLAEDDAGLRAALRPVLLRALREARPADAADLLGYAGLLAKKDGSAEAPLLFAAGASALRAALTGDAVADRGYWTTLSDLYAQAGDLKGAQQVLQDAIAAWPHEFTYLNALAGLLEDEGHPAEALPYALGALATSYGDTRLRAVARCARLMRDLGKPAEALALVEETLASAPRPGPEDDVRTGRYLAVLEALRAELSAPPAAKPSR